jgi:hypothetical protein
VAEGEVEATTAHLSTTVDPRPESLRELRTSVRAWLEGAGVDEVLRDSVILATHEAAAAAVGKKLSLEVEAILDEGASVSSFAAESGLRSRTKRTGCGRAFIHDLAPEVEVQSERSALALTFLRSEEHVAACFRRPA